VSSVFPLRPIATILVVSILIPIVPFLIVGELPGERWLNAEGGSATGFALMGTALLAADVVIPIPSSILGSLLGARLGFGVGFVATFAGLMLGNLVGYGLGRLFFARHRSEAMPAAPTVMGLMLSRSVPVLAEALTFAAGATKLPFATVFGSLCVGNAIYAGALAGSGAAWLPAAFLGPGLLVPMLVPAVGWWIWRRRRTQPSDHTAQHQRE
jgi:membrane protein YqaA with SNARE-associated domain